MTDTINADKDMTNDRLKHMPWKALRMFVELGQDAQKELEDRAKKSWDEAERKFALKFRNAKHEREIR